MAAEQPFNKYLGADGRFLLLLRMAENLVTAILQADLIWEDPTANLNAFREKIQKLSPEVDLIVLPEMFSTGFSMNAAALAEPSEGRSLEWMREVAALKDAAVTGSVIIEEAAKFYNRLFFVFPDGSYKTYDKRHTFTLAGEHEVYESGKERLTLIYKGWIICPLICYDLRFPVWARNTEDYDLLLYVANWPAVRTTAWDTLLKARAIENLSYCIGVNRVGTDGNKHPYLGHSAVYDCLGAMISTLDFEKEFQQEVVLRKSHVKETREKLRFLQDRDTFEIH